MMTPTFSTTAFQFAHGRKPRGRGRWAFDLHRPSGTDIVWFSGTFSEAKRLAIAEAKARGDVTRIEVGS